MSNENVHPIFKGVLDSIMPAKAKKIKIGDEVIYIKRRGKANVRAIEMIAPDTNFADDNDNIPMQEVWECDKNRCVFDLDNGHWAYGRDITLAPTT